MSLQSNSTLASSLASINVGPGLPTPTGYIQTMAAWFALFADKTATPNGGIVPYTFGLDSSIVSFPELGEIVYQPNTNFGVPDPISGVIDNARYTAAFWNGYEWQSISGSGTVSTAIVTRSTTEDDVEFEGNINVYKEVTGGAFPTLIAWYPSSAKLTTLKEIIITRDAGQKPTTIVYKFYVANVLSATWTDTITYSGPFEVSRTRSVT
jgi:hypothetical protein